MPGCVCSRLSVAARERVPRLATNTHCVLRVGGAGRGERGRARPVVRVARRPGQADVSRTLNSVLKCERCGVYWSRDDVGAQGIYTVGLDRLFAATRSADLAGDFEQWRWNSPMPLLQGPAPGAAHPASGIG